MITAEIALIPVGTGSTSVSEYIAVAERVLKNYPNLEFKIRSMSTEICGEPLEDVFKAMLEMHQAVIAKGAKRVNTAIRIDDRRDKDTGIDEKIKSVESKM